MLELLDAIKIATKAAEGLQAIRSRTESSDSRIQDMVSKVLRTIYFPPDGILGLLNEVAEGQKPTEKRLKQGLTDFNDRQWTIERDTGRTVGRVRHGSGLARCPGWQRDGIRQRVAA